LQRASNGQAARAKHVPSCEVRFFRERCGWRVLFAALSQVVIPTAGRGATDSPTAVRSPAAGSTRATASKQVAWMHQGTDMHSAKRRKRDVDRRTEPHVVLYDTRLSAQGLSERAPSCKSLRPYGHDRNNGVPRWDRDRRRARYDRAKEQGTKPLSSLSAARRQRGLPTRLSKGEATGETRGPLLPGCWSGGGR